MDESRYPYPEVEKDPHLTCVAWRIIALVSIGFWIGVGTALYMT